MKKSESSKNLKKSESAKNLKKSKSVANLKRTASNAKLIDEKINNFKSTITPTAQSQEIQDLVNRGYQILKDMNNIDEIKLGYHIRIKLKSTLTKKNTKISKGGFLVKVVKEVIDGKLEFYLQLKAYNKIYRYNINDIAYIFYKEVTPNAIKIEKLNKKIEDMEKQHKLDYLKLIKILKTNNIYKSKNK